MNFFIENRDVAIILPALDLFRDYLENDDHAPSMDHLPFTLDDVKNLFQKFDKAFKNTESPNAT